MYHRANRAVSKGDTIVEVLIAIAIVSSVLAGAFTVTQKSAMAVRDSEEHSEALSYLQGQVELVRTAALQANASDSLFTNGGFCMTSGPPPARGPVCTGVGPGNLYTLTDTYVSATKAFTFQATWNNVQGGTSSVRLHYRIYPGK